MTQLTPAQVRHIAKLARLKLTDEEVERYAKELSSILAYVDTLQKVDTSGVEATAQVTGLLGIERADEVYPTPLADPDALLASSPLSIVERQIQTPSAHG